MLFWENCIQELNKVDSKSIPLFSKYQKNLFIHYIFYA